MLPADDMEKDRLIVSEALEALDEDGWEASRQKTSLVMDHALAKRIQKAKRRTLSLLNDAGLYQYHPRAPQRITIPALAAILASAALILLLISRSLKPASLVPSDPRKAIVISSYMSQNLTWMDDLSGDWEIYRYVMDDPNAPLHPPVNAGREAMTYLSFIIDYYDNLPDYVVFIHGHERAWHQPEPMQWRLESLNLEALERDRYISLLCVHLTTCDKPRLDFSLDYEKLDRTARLIPWFWRYAEISDEVPRYLTWPEGAQFAVSKAAIMSRTRDWWYRYRKPILVSDSSMELFDSQGYYWGLVHERLWHVAFGMPPEHCPSPEYCTKVQWSNGVLCDVYPTLPIMKPWLSHDDVLRYVTCFRNDNGTKDWELKRWSLCNSTEYLASEHPKCPFSGWALP